MKKDEYKKEFCKLIQKIAGKHPLWNVWNDFLHIAAISMANAVPTPEREEREKLYLNIVSKYTKTEMDTFARLFAIVIEALEVCPEQDFLGELYHMLNLQQNQKGQFFTPYHICDFMSEVQALGTEDLLIKKPYISVSDPACGAGAMLIAFANVLRNKKINYQQRVLFIAQDIDLTAVLMCYIQLSLLGCAAIVIHGDSLAKPGFHPDNDIWQTVMYHVYRYKFSDFFYCNSGDEIADEKPVKELPVKGEGQKDEMQKKNQPDVVIKKNWLDKLGQQRLDIMSL